MSTNSIPVILCETDYNRLTEIVVIDKKAGDAGDTLAHELSRATVVKDEDFPQTNIRIGSYVRILDTDTKKERDFQLVMPAEADIHAKKISVLSPMAAAIIGFSSGNEVNWNMPSGLKKLKILEVKNTPLVNA